MEYLERSAVIAAVDTHLSAVLNKASDKTQLDCGIAAGYDMAHRHCIDVISTIPAADVRPVVTCGECKHYKRRYWNNGKCYGTFCDIWNRDHGKTFFCSAGKREVEHEQS